ncbi:MAG: serine--tRNA ligase [Devosia sp.]|uniref:serine--tRNA ligase n=1 Tax=Devosia sp. TaxID=1871048 RepID=UPI001AC23861|nr:serine--tRNA ligase [Devosia sp.]MBN9316019.1 serine--tRNA ligase [Devosia sp.]
MFDINWIKANPAAFDAALAGRKNVPFTAAQLLEMDESRRTAIAAVEEAQAKRNALSKQIGQAKAQKDDAKAQALMDEVAHLKDVVQSGEAARKEAEDKLRQALSVIPNLPLAEVPRGNDESDNVEYFGRNGSPETAAKNRPAKPSFGYRPREHFETGEALGQMDFEVAAKLSGARFVVLKSHLARLERAIGQFMLDLHVDEHGYTEVQPPLLVKDDALYGTNQLPKFEQDLFKTHKSRALADLDPKLASQFKEVAALKEVDGTLVADENATFDRARSEEWLQQAEKANALYLIPTAEVPLTNMVRESILSEEQLPMRLTALTPCFRSEAGSAGRDTRGMLRQHQFNKVEMVAITTPEASGDEHEKMLSDAEDVLRQLGIHYRVMMLSTGDMGFGAQKTYDLEAWLPGQDTYREISSVSVCGDFQARRMDARYRDKDGKVRHVHTLNGSGVAVGRALIAVMENYQQEDGSVLIPEVLQPYMKGLKTIGARS